MTTDLLVRDEQTGKVVRVAADKPVVVGRKTPGVDLDIATENPHVSRKHCEIHLDRDGHLRIVDTSSFGVFVNGSKLAREGKARPGDRIVLGHDFTLTVIAVDANNPSLEATSPFDPDDPAGQMRRPQTARGPERLVGGTIGERYRVVRIIGRGGMGAVLEAQDELRKVRCAIKVLLSGESATPELVARFKREAVLSAKLGDCPAIVAAFDLGTLADSGELFYALDFVEGPSLSRLCDQGIDRALGIGLVIQVARAVAFAHDRGIIHRDLKPDNVLVTPDGQARLIDFGLAKALDEVEALTATRTGMGTPSYMAPEQIANAKKAGKPADVYGLGGILYKVLTGKPPYSGGPLAQVLEMIKAGDLVSPIERDPTIDPALSTLCRKALAVNPADRHASAASFAADLEAWLIRQTPTVTPAGMAPAASAPAPSSPPAPVAAPAKKGCLVFLATLASLATLCVVCLFLIETCM